jgi:signal transduction histidine kinase
MKTTGDEPLEKIIEAHNCKIWAENNPEEGATFSFMLPYEQKVD